MAEWIDFKKQKPQEKKCYLYCTKGRTKASISWYYWDGDKFWDNTPDYFDGMGHSCYDPDYWMDVAGPHYHKMNWTNTDGKGRIGQCECGYEEIITDKQMDRKEKIEEYKRNAEKTYYKQEII